MVALPLRLLQDIDPAAVDDYQVESGGHPQIAMNAGAPRSREVAQLAEPGERCRLERLAVIGKLVSKASLALERLEEPQPVGMNPRPTPLIARLVARVLGFRVKTGNIDFPQDLRPRSLPTSACYPELIFDRFSPL